MADGGATATHPSFTFSFKARHGWHVSISAYICGGKGSGVGVSASKAGSHYSFNHNYSAAARKSGCTGSTTLRSGKMHAHWGKLFSLKMTIKGAGVKTAMAPPKGCTGVPGHQRPIAARGTMRLRIHKKVLGSISKSKLKGMAQLFDSSKNFKCTGGAQAPKATFANGMFGANFLSATKYDKSGNTLVTVSGGDHPGAGVFGGFGDTFFGAPFTFSKNLESATVGSITSFMSGSVSFTGTSSTPPGCESGTWNTGTLKVHDGLASTTLVGSSTASGNLDKSACFA